MKLRLLVVDDSRAYADAFAKLLSLLGHHAEAAYNGVEALQAAVHLRPHAVLLRSAVPGMNGLELASRLLAQQPNLHVAAIRGPRDPTSVQGAREAGVRSVLAKPVGLAELERLLGEIADGSRLDHAASPHPPLHHQSSAKRQAHAEDAVRMRHRVLHDPHVAAWERVRAGDELAALLKRLRPRTGRRKQLKHSGDGALEPSATLP